jgi:hypothetical protein
LQIKILITEAEFSAWKELEETKVFFGKLKAMREQIKEDLIHQLYDNPEFACGKAALAEDLLGMKYEDFVEKVD